MTDNQAEVKVENPLHPAENLLYGWISGCSGKIVEYPLDTLKVRLQTGGYSGPVACIRSVIAEEGMLAFYRGLVTPLIGAGFEVSMLFFGYGLCEKLLRSEGEEVLPLYKVFLAGMGSGFGSTVVLTPVELIKCRLQVDKIGQYKGPIDCVKQSIAADGTMALFRGSLSTMLREVPGNGAWFGAYYFFGRLFSPTGKVSDGSQTAQLIAGGLGGCAYWGIPYPMDTIKSTVQTMPKGTSTFAVARQLIKERGFFGLYKGCGVTLVRAFPGNAVTFWMFERVSSILHPHFS